MNITYEKQARPIYYSSDSFLMPLPHMHKELEIIYVNKGKAIAATERNRYIINSGDLLIIFPNQIHYYETLEMGDYKVMVFSSDLIKGLDSKLENFVPASNAITPKQDGMIVTAIHKLYEQYEQNSLTYITGWLNLLMDSLVSEIEFVPSMFTESPTLRTILNYCSKNFKDKITLDVVSKELHISKYHISHLINDRLSLSFSEYINFLRINEACRLLENSNLKLADISENVGFGSIRSFNRCFLENMHMTPSQYKELMFARQVKKI